MNLKRIAYDFISDIRGFLSFGHVLGIDLGTASVKFVELSKKGELLTLENYGMLQMREHFERANAVLQSGSLGLDEREAVRVLKILVGEVKPRVLQVVASAPAFSTFSVSIEMPLLSPEETERSIAFQARQYIPMPIADVGVEWEKVGEFDDSQGRRSQRVFVSAAPNALVAKYRAVFREAGLKLVAMETESAALARALALPAGQPVLVIDIGTESTSITVMRGRTVVQVSQSDYGGISLTQALARSLGVSVSRAEELKRRRGLISEGAKNLELSTSLLPFLDVIMQECERARGVYERANKISIASIVLTGGGANLGGIQEYFHERMQLPVEEPRPFASLAYPPFLEPAMRALNRECGVAVGLALRKYRP